ncbi:MAG: hypothetical protein LBT52_01235, partial [Clostridiales Family XIII bacterium]|nr:hypothetical protein [Clostridiales Family XIII bacterium]
MSNSVVIMMDMLLPLLIAMAVTAVVTWRLIPALRKLNTIQHVYEDAPVTHKIKQGTPTMGGVAIIAGIIISCVFTQVRIGFSLPLLVVMLVTVGFGLIGFIDDYTKIAKRRNKGLTPKQKLALQIALSLAFAIYLVYFGDHGNFGAVIIPFVWTEINIGWLIIPYIVFILVAMTNAVNLTDGLDGLCAGTSGMVSLFYPLILIAGGMAWAAAEMPLLGDADFGAWIKAEEAI